MMTKSILLKDGRTLVIRAPGPEDAAAVIAYLNQIGGESDNLTFGKNGFHLSVEEEAEVLRKARESGVNLMLMGLIDGRIVTMTNLSRSTRDRLKHVGVFGVSVLKDCWGLGICRHMMQAVADWARANGVRKIDLKVRADNARAIRIYEKFGFQHEGRHPRELFIGGQYFDELSMGLWLDS